MTKQAPRKARGTYHSPVRAEQARETRRRMEDAARALFLERGFGATTMDAIAERAGVATPTVYAAFGSKVGIVRALLDRARFGPGYRELLESALAETDPLRRLAYPARIARRVYDAERAEVQLLTTAASLSAELAEAERERESTRYEAQAHLVKSLAEAGALRLEVRRARDALWALTSRELYRLLVVERGWSSDEYERWLGEQIANALVGPRARRRAAKKPRKKT